MVFLIGILRAAKPLSLGYADPAPLSGEPRETLRIRLVFLIGILRAANPSATLTRGPPPLSGAVGLGSPVGELSSASETEGVWFVEW